MDTQLTKNQKGAVLGFSLMMLTMLTLVSVSMMRENKAQIMVANNAGQQTQTFSTVEAALNATGGALDILRLDLNSDGVVSSDEKSSHHCLSGLTHSIHPVPHTSGYLTGLPSGVSAQIKEVYCISNYVDSDKVVDANGNVVSNGPKPPAGNEFKCLYSAPGIRNIEEGSVDAGDTHADPPVPPIPSADNVNACNKLTAAGNWTAGTPNPNACQIESYIVHVTLSQSDGAQRTLESKYELDCSGDLNP